MYSKSRFVAREYFTARTVDEVDERCVTLCREDDIHDTLNISWIRIFLHQSFSIRKFFPGLFDLIEIESQFDGIFPVHQPVDHAISIVFAEHMLP